MARKFRKQRKRNGDSPPLIIDDQTRMLLDGNTPQYLVTAIFFIHFLGLSCLFKPWTGIFNSEAIIEQDWGLHLHHLAALEGFWRGDRMLWGYNPFFMAGYPSNTIQDLSIKFFELAALALSAIALTPLQWFKILALLAMASVPWLGYFTARNLFVADHRKHLIALTAALLMTIYWWNSLPREMFFYGMIGFSAAAYLSVWGVSLFYRLAAGERSLGWTGAGWLLFAAAILPLHVQSVIIFLPPLLALLAFARHRISRRLVAWSAAALFVGFLANLPWLALAFAHRGNDVSAAIVQQLPIFASVNPFTFFLDYLGPQGFWTFRVPLLEKGFRLVLLVLALVGIRTLFREGKRELGGMLASAAAGLFLFAYFGALVPGVRGWQPLRFKVPLDLFLALAAAYSIVGWLGASREKRSTLLPVLLGCGLVSFAANLIHTEASGRLRLRAQVTPPLAAITDWISQETPGDARVLFEESGDETGFVYDGVYLSSLLPQRIGRQFIGGPINLYNDRHHFAEFHSGRMFGKNILALSDQELRSYLDLYNIGAIVAFHPASIKRLQALPGLISLERRIGPVHLMKVRQPLSWFIKGQGTVKAGWNRLELADLSGDEVILKYHWVNGLTASPPARLDPVLFADDPIPFIKISSPPARLSLRVR